MCQPPDVSGRRSFLFKIHNAFIPKGVYSLFEIIVIKPVSKIPGIPFRQPGTGALVHCVCAALDYGACDIDLEHITPDRFPEGVDACVGFVIIQVFHCVVMSPGLLIDIVDTLKI